MILFSLPSVNNLGFFDKIVSMKRWALDIANEDWAFDITNEDWAFDIPTGTGLLILQMRIGL